MLAAACLLLTLAACAPPLAPRTPPRAAGMCSWFGDARSGVLYFGESGFWHAMREAGGDPAADTETTAPQVVGRFDLASERMLPPLPTGNVASHSGTWDVLAHPNGRVYFTSFYDPSGWVDPATGAALRFERAGTGLNELALLPDGRLLATRYGAPGGGDGSIVVLEQDGVIAREIALVPEPGAVVAAKSISFDPVRAVVWVNTDLIPAGGGASRHDARVVDLASGRQLARFTEPELQFPRFAPDGTSYFAWLDGTRLVLRVAAPGENTGPASGREILLDAGFPAGLDFVQDVLDQPDGRVVATRWSGAVHVLEQGDRLRTTQLPRSGAPGFYYTAVATGDRVCATYCQSVEVICGDL